MKIRKVLTLDEEVCKRISAYADENGLAFSGAVSVLANQALQAQKGIDSLQQISKMFEEVKKQQNVMQISE